MAISGTKSMAKIRAIIEPEKNRFLLPFDEKIAQIIPNVSTFSVGGVKLLALPHTYELTRFARNMGYIVPAPIVYYYKWPGPTPFRTQVITSSLLTMNKRAYVLSEMGTGKTRSALFSIDYMLQEGLINKVLIIAPLSILSQVWDREIFEYFGHLNAVVVHGSRGQRLRVLKEPHQIYIINHDGVKVVQDELEKMKFGVIIIDEVAAFRNQGTDRWKSMNRIVQGTEYVWGLTGSPTPQAPTDAWALGKLLTPNRVPKYFKQFKRETMTQVSQFKWVPKKTANESVYEILQPAVRYKRDDCVELPPVSYQDRNVTLSLEAAKVYKEMMNKLAIEFKEGKVTAVNEGVLCSKLLQIVSGWVYTKDKSIVHIDNKPRVAELLEIIEECSSKLIVFCQFIHTATKLYNILHKHEGIDAALITGGTSKAQRDEIFSAFQREDSPRVLVAHPKCMAHGLNLTAANTIVWFTPTSLETYEQACARITRPGQTSKQLIIHLTGSPIETKLYKRLQNKASTQG